MKTKFIVISEARLTQILKTKKRCQQSYVNTICKSIRVTILIVFRFIKGQMVSPKKVHVQTIWNFRLQKIAQAVIKLVSQKWWSDNWMVSLCKVFGQGWVFTICRGLKCLRCIQETWQSLICRCNWSANTASLTPVHGLLIIHFFSMRSEISLCE
jgi:hypothetical protein